MSLRFPQWLFVICGTVICALFVSTVGLATYIFTSLASRVDKIDENVSQMKQQVVVLQSQVDTQSRFLKQKGE